MSLPIKAGIATITISSIGGAAYLGSTYISNSNKELDTTPKTSLISKLIEDSQEYVLLDPEKAGDSDNKYWQANWESYKEDSKKLETDIFSLAGWDKVKLTDLTALLKTKCKTESKKSILNNTDPAYQNVTKYCARGVTIEEDLKNKGITPLITESNSGKDAGIWKSRHDKRVDLQTTLSKLGVTETGDQITEEKIKNACSTSKTKHKKEKDYQATLEAFKEVCIRKTGEIA